MFIITIDPTVQQFNEWRKLKNRNLVPGGATYLWFLITKNPTLKLVNKIKQNNLATTCFSIWMVPFLGVCSAGYKWIYIYIHIPTYGSYFTIGNTIFFTPTAAPTCLDPSWQVMKKLLPLLACAVLCVAQEGAQSARCLHGFDLWF